MILCLQVFSSIREFFSLEGRKVGPGAPFDLSESVFWAGCQGLNTSSSWWFEPTHLQNMLVKMGIFTQVGGENNTYLSCHHLVFGALGINNGYFHCSIWVFPKTGVGPQNGWFMMENPIKMDDLGYHCFFGNTHFVDQASISPAVAPS